MHRTEVITLDKANTYDLGSHKALIEWVKVYGDADPSNIGDYFPPITSAMSNLNLTGKFAVVSQYQPEGTKSTYTQLIADGENTICSTYIKIDLSKQKVFNKIYSFQIKIKIVE
jgi:hypothetical protein